MLDAYTDGQYSKVYFFGVIYILNIATTTGYGNMITYNRTERIVFLFMIYFCDIFFAYAFGLMASESKLFPEKYNAIFDRISKINTILDQNKIAPSLKFKVEQYFSYMIKSRNIGTESLETLTDLLPRSFVRYRVVGNLI